MSKKLLYVCNKKKCKDRSCDWCRHTSDAEFAERDENGRPVIAAELTVPGWLSDFKEVEK